MIICPNYFNMIVFELIKRCFNKDSDLSDQELVIKVCKYCGHQYEPGETFCPDCGAVETEIKM